MISLITVNDIKTGTSISNSIKTEILQPFIELSELDFIKPVIGADLLEELKQQIGTGVTANTLTTLNRILLSKIKPVNCYGAWFKFVRLGHYKQTEKGVTKQSSNDSESVDRDELNDLKKDLKEIIATYDKELRDYLEDNKTSYPLYNSTCGSGAGNDFTTGIYLGGSN